MKQLQNQWNRAVSLQNSGRIAQAIDIYSALLPYGAHKWELWFMLGTACSQIGDFEQGITCLRNSLKINPNNSSAYHNLGNALKVSKCFGEALSCLNKAIQISPDDASYYISRGIIFHELKRFNEALNDYQIGIALNPSDALAYYVQGNTLQQMNFLIEAVESYQRSLAINGSYCESHTNLGSVFEKLGMLDDALLSYERAFSVNPNNAEAYTNAGCVLALLNRFDEALAAQLKAIEIKPDWAEAYRNLGYTLQGLGKLPDALENYDRAISLKQNYAEAYTNRGMLMCELRMFKEALANYECAIAIKPDLVEAYLCKSFAHLTMGEYEIGWELFEWRWKNWLQRSSKRTYEQKLWLGGESLAGKTILVYPEQGLGDVVQFSRYIPMLVENGANVIFEVPQPLVNIMQSLPCNVTIVETGKETPYFDRHCPIMSLPLAFKTTVESIPKIIPYLFVNSGKKQKWGSKFSNSSNLRVGLVWSGGFRPHQPEVWAINERRNIPLAKLKRLKISGVDFYSLQKGDDALDQLNKLTASDWGGPAIIDYSSEFEDFLDTAALIANLDLVISVDTSTAHVAGAIGKPVWLLNRFDTDWRWFQDVEYSPWYPSTRIFRQPKLGDWDPVVAKVKNALEELVGDR